VSPKLSSAPYSTGLFVSSVPSPLQQIGPIGVRRKSCGVAATFHWGEAETTGTRTFQHLRLELAPVARNSRSGLFFVSSASAHPFLRCTVTLLNSPGSSGIDLPTGYVTGGSHARRSRTVSVKCGSLFEAIRTCKKSRATRVSPRWQRRGQSSLPKMNPTKRCCARFLNLNSTKPSMPCQRL
jgi:hypothetical protein